MSDNKWTQGLETTVNDDPEEFPVAVPTSKDELPMTLSELQEAFRDKSHPRHAEAVQRNEVLAEQLRPAMERLRQTVMDQSGMNEQLTRIQKTLSDSMPKLPPGIDISKLVAPRADVPKADTAIPVIEQIHTWQDSLRDHHEELQRVIDANAEAQTERQEMEDERAKQTLEVLVSMEAHLVQLNNRIKSVDSRIEAGNASSSKVAGRTIAVAVLTLLATIGSIVVTLLLNT
ncbi:hypothetical protein [Trueperella pecoris]|nr:hypothetical protein [Trueperella pecoris]QOQ38622.1 hypothetical protein HLG82_03600 [Trueperella pecoris]